MISGKYFISFDRTRIWYSHSKGKKDNLLFLHGLTGNSTAWFPAYEYFLKKGFSCTLMDTRGHGMSDKPVDYMVKTCAKDVFMLLKHLNIKKTIIIGHCGGSMIAMNFAERYPKYIKKIVLVSSSYNVKSSYYNFVRYYACLVFSLIFLFPAFKLLRLEKKGGWVDYKYYRGTSDLYFPRIFDDLKHVNIIPFIKSYYDIGKLNYKKKIKSFDYPVLIIHGEKDTTFPVKIAYKMNKLIKNSDLQIIMNEGHIPLVNNPELVNELIYGFLKR
ncbi:MAG: alpha/beta hydrolase [Nanoarchaeota archaeon]|nr:alpha/beta hydrolase [Nanoarchaeota archaeon]